jgi:general stress protein 26
MLSVRFAFSTCRKHTPGTPPAAKRWCARNRHGMLATSHPPTGIAMDPDLRSAIETLHGPADWVHLATTGRDGEPHVTPVMMCLHADGLLFSLTGQQKRRNMGRDPRACVAISQPGTLAHVIVWGTMDMRTDAEAQRLWDQMIAAAFGAAGLEQRARTLSDDGTCLGILTPARHRIYGVE